MGDYESIARRFESNFDMSLARGEGILVRSASAETVHSCGRKVGVGKLQLVGDGGIFSCAFVMASLFIVASLLAATTVTAFAPAASKLPLRSAPPQHTTPAFPLRSSNRPGPAGAVRMAVGDPQLLPLLDPDTAIAVGAYATCQVILPSCPPILDVLHPRCISVLSNCQGKKTRVSGLPVRDRHIRVFLPFSMHLSRVFQSVQFPILRDPAKALDVFRAVSNNLQQ